MHHSFSIPRPRWFAGVAVLLLGSGCVEKETPGQSSPIDVEDAIDDSTDDSGEPSDDTASPTDDTASPTDDTGPSPVDSGAASDDTGSADADTGIDADDTGTSTGVMFAGIETVSWDGADGLIASWSAGSSLEPILYTVTVRTPDGATVSTVDAPSGPVTMTGLADGEYQLSVEAKAGTGTAGADRTIDQLVGSNRLVYRSEVPLSGAMDVWGDGAIHVIAGGLNDDVGVHVVDTTDPTSPEIIATLTDIGRVRDVKVVDGLLFTTNDPVSDDCVLCDDVGIRIFDFSDPTHPVLLSEIGPPDNAVHNVSYADGVLTVTSISSDSLAIYDLTDPTAPERIASWHTALEPDVPPPPPPPHGSSEVPDPAPHDQVIVGDTVYVAHAFGFSSVDISEPATPEETWAFFVDMGGHNIWPVGDGVHVVTTREIVGGHMQIWDVSDPEDPIEVASHTTGEEHCIHNVVVDGDHLFASWYKDGVLVFDISDPTDPVLLGQYDTNDHPVEIIEMHSGPAPDIRGAWGVWPFGDHIAVGDTERGLIILDFFPVTILHSDP